MKIAIVDYTQRMKTPRMEEYAAMGASDAAVLHVSKLLVKLGHEVTLMCNTNATTIHEGVSWTPFVDTQTLFDVVIIQRRPVAYERMKYKKLIYWMHDDIDAPVMQGLDNFMSIPDAFIVLSKYHKERVLSKFNIDEKKIFIIPEGISVVKYDVANEKYKAKGYPSLVFASAPVKGLPMLHHLWPRIKAKVPNAHLTILSSMKLYASSDHDKHFEKIYEDFAQDVNVLHFQEASNNFVLNVMLQSDIMVYPCTFPETYCAAAAESISCRTPVITTNLGALPETVGDAGVIIEGNIRTEEVKEKFVDAVVKALTDERYHIELERACMRKKVATWTDTTIMIDQVIRSV